MKLNSDDVKYKTGNTTKEYKMLVSSSVVANDFACFQSTCTHD